MPNKKTVRLATYAGKGAKGFADAEKKKELMYGKTDRQPRFEIDDSKAFITPIRDLASQSNVPLHRVFSHPELYKNYPELKDLKFTLSDKTPDNLAGFFDPSSKSITIRRPSDAELLDDPDYVKRTLIHELQHLIQNKEGFAYSTPKSLFDYDERPGEQEAYSAEARIDLTPEQRKQFPDRSLYAKDKRNIVPQEFYTTQEQIEAAIKKELDRRLKVKEEMPEGFEHYTTSTAPVYPKRNVLGVIYPEASSAPSGAMQPKSEPPVSPRQWWESVKGDYAE